MQHSRATETELLQDGDAGAGCVERVLALDALLKDLVLSLAPGAPVLRVAVSSCAAGDFVARPAGEGFELLVASGRDGDFDAQRLGRVARELEVLEYCGAFAALYMEEGGLDSPAGFIRRVGLRYVQERIDLDPVGRAALFHASRAAAADQGRAASPAWPLPEPRLNT